MATVVGVDAVAAVAAMVAVLSLLCLLRLFWLLSLLLLLPPQGVRDTAATMALTKELTVVFVAAVATVKPRL